MKAQKEVIRDLFEEAIAQKTIGPEDVRGKGPREFLNALPEDMKRMNMCPVRNRKVQEFQIPLSLLTHDDPRSQNREGTSAAEVARKVGQMVDEQYGQITGILVFLNRFQMEGVFPPVWGNHRLEAAEEIDAVGDRIYNCRSGHIWASVYDEAPTQYRHFQVKENNKRAANYDATKKQNFTALESMAATGDFDAHDPVIFGTTGTRAKWKFEEQGRLLDVTEAEQRRRLSRALKAMGVTKDVKALVDQWCETDGNQAKTYSRSKLQMKNTFNSANDHGINIELGSSVGKSQKFSIVDNGVKKTICMYFMTEGKGGSAYGQMAHEARNFPQIEIDEVWCCVSIPIEGLTTSRRKMEQYRERWIKWAEQWNSTVKSGKVFDRWFFPPQSQHEKRTCEGAWILEHKF